MNQIIQLISLNKIGKLTELHQVFIVTVLFLTACVYYYLDFHATGTFSGFPASPTILFVPIYEEIIFRGIILGGLLSITSKKKAFIISSILFGIWHIKNFPFMENPDLFTQVLYTGLIFAPFTNWLALKYKTIWIGVVFHYIHNMLAPLTWSL